jgi:glycolate oxidase iron-sulfur subunit
LGARAIQQLPSQELQFLATSNSGCALQLASGLRQAGRKIRTVHPVELVEISLREKGSEQA